MSLGGILLFRVMLVSSLFTALVTLVSFYADYQGRIGEINGLFKKIEETTINSVALSIYQFELRNTKTLTEGILSIPEITKVEIFDQSNEVLLKKETEAVKFGDLTSSERLANALFSTKIVRESKLQVKDEFVGRMVYVASLTSMYGRLIERLFVFFITQAFKTFAVSMMILLICRHLFTRKLSQLSEAVQRAERIGVFDATNIKSKPTSRFITEIDILIAAFIHYHNCNLESEHERKILSNISEKVLWMTRESDVSNFGLDHILAESKLESVHFYRKDSSVFTLHSSRYRDTSQQKTQDLPTVFNTDDMPQDYSITVIDLPAKNRSKFIYPLHRADSLLGIYIGYGLKEDTEKMLDYVDFWNTLQHILSMSLTHSSLYENLEKRVDYRTNELKNALKIQESQHVELKAAQERMVQSEKMASLGTLIAGVAHEINNPTNFISVSVKNMEKEAGGFEKSLKELMADEKLFNELFLESFSKLKNNCDIISNGTARIKQLVANLSSFSRLDRSDLKKSNIGEIINSTISLIRPSYEGKVEFQLDTKYSPEVNCWPAKLGQVFMNLIVNSCQAMAVNASSNAPTVKIKTIESNDMIEILISDNGPGIDPQVQKKIFDPFFTTKDVGEGTGLGLSISYQIIEEHEGNLSVSSVQGQGATFKILLPKSRGDNGTEA